MDTEIDTNTDKKLKNSLRIFAKDLTTYITKTSEKLEEELKKYQTESKSLQLKWKYELMGPISYFLENLVHKFQQITKNAEKIGVTKLQEVESSLSKSRELIKNVYTENKIDISQSLLKYEKVYFPNESSQQVYIGDLDSNDKRTGFGSLSDGILLYRGSWKNDKRHGFGIQVYEDGEIFAGKWNEGKPDIGRWVFDDQSVFYGIFNRTGVEETEWKLGLSSVDHKKVHDAAAALFEKKKNLFKSDLKKTEAEKGFEKIKNIFYYQDQPTLLYNVYLKKEDDIDIRALAGKKPLKKVKIRFLDGVEYTGCWKNFEPNFLGKIKAPEEEEIKIITRSGRVLPYEKIEKSGGGGNLTEEQIIERVTQDKTLKKIRITFFDGTVYDGGVSQNLDFHGYGVLTYPDSKFEHGIFTYDSGLKLKFSKECFKKLQEINAYDYLEDSQSYNKKTGFEGLWVEIVEQGNSYNRVFYKGNWVDFFPEKEGRFKKSMEETSFKCYTNERIMFNALDYKASLYKKRLLDFSDDIYTRNIDHVKSEKICFGKDGSKYEGIGKPGKTDYSPDGYGIYTDENDIKYEGIWDEGNLILDKNFMKKMERQEILELKKTTKKVEYQNGVIFDGQWDGYVWKSGTVIVDGKKIEFPGEGFKQKGNKVNHKKLLKKMNEILKPKKLKKDFAKKRLLLCDLDDMKLPGQNIKRFYEDLIKKQRYSNSSKKIQFLFNYNFINQKTTEYMPYSTVSGSHIVENFEIYYMKKSKKIKF